MVDLNEFYDNRAGILFPDDHLKQVGHTVGGKTISEAELKAIVDDIVEILKLSDEDNLLELCCGNGVITKRLSFYVKHIFAIDSSEKLIDVALSKNQNNLISYSMGDILELNELLKPEGNYTKVLMFAALQHFKKEQLSEIINLIRPFCHSDFKLLFGFVPDINKRWCFYDTFDKRKQYLFRRLSNTDVMGTWWNKKFIYRVCAEMSLKCEFIDIPENRYGGSYRFHVLVS